MEPSPSFVYPTLPPHCIRVLELHPGRSDMPLSCSIVVQKITAKPYEAISYVWGDPTPTNSINCFDGAQEGILGIGANLTKALVTFRLIDRPRRIWVDALSINQEDLTERQSQVRLIGKVFSDAECVLCWLGDFNDLEDGEFRARLATNFLRNFNRKPQEHLQVAYQLLFSENCIAEWKPTVLASWRAVKELFDLEYFHRVWVIQEVGVARHARMFWGSSQVWLDWTEVAAFSGYMDAKGASIVNHLQLKSWMANHVTLVWDMTAEGHPIYSFVEVLHWARVHQCTDPRDRIYGLLSHPSAIVNGSLLIEPSYRISTSQAYTDLAVNVIEQTNSLQTLALVDHGEDSGQIVLPTWVPDWQAVNLVAPLRSPTKAAAETDDSISVTQSKSRTVLKCHGIHIDAVYSMSDMMDPTEFTITNFEREIQKKNPFFIDHFWKQIVAISGMPPASMEQLANSLSFVLTGGYRDDVPTTEAGILEQQRADFASYILEFERIRPSNYTGGFMASLSSRDREWIESLAETGSAGQFIQDMTWTCMCRKVFQTAKGHIGLGPRTVKEGDVCVVLRGAVYPMILRGCDGYFELVGPALLYGFMNGEVVQSCSNGRLVQREFQII
ncbi:Heterokaryon incompatibility protein (HET) domain containing protein [Elaphomyces granulatus]